MPELKKQHLVPELHLKRFSYDNKQTNILNVKAEKIIPLTPYMNHCHKDYYYGKDGKYERMLSKLEVTWAAIFDKIIENNDYYPTKEEIERIKEFALYQKNRVLIMKTQIEELKWKTVSVALKMKFGDIDEEAKRKLKKMFLDKHGQNIPQFCLDMAVELKKYISDLGLLIVNYKSKSELITSDNPIISYNNYCTNNVGLGSVGLIIFFPISPNKLIVLYDKKMYPKYSQSKIVNLNNDTEIEWLNKFQIISAVNLVIFRNHNQSNSVLRLYKALKKDRSQFFRKVEPYEFAPGFSNMIIHEQPYYPIDYNFSFARLTKRAINISKYKNTIIGQFPRSFDKQQLFSMSVRENLPSLKAGDFQNNEKKVKEVNKFMSDYWNDNL